MRLPHRLYRHTPRHIPRRPKSIPNNLQNTNQCFRCPGSTRDGNGGENIALLIDADNVSHKVLTSVMNEVNKNGTASVRRIYADWTNPAMSKWRESIQHHAIVPIQQFAYVKGKNSSDGAMMVDAMDLLHTDRFSRFCLITSDSDFTRLVTRIREQGVSVHGFGNDVTHRAFIVACSKFFYLSDLSSSSDSQKRGSIPLASPTPVAPTLWSSWRTVFSNSNSSSTTSTKLTSANRIEDQSPGPTPHIQGPEISDPKPLDQAVVEGIRKVILDHQKPANQDTFIDLNLVWQRLKKLSPDLHFQNYGYTTQRDFILASKIVELNAEDSRLARLKDWREEKSSAAPLISTQNPARPYNRVALGRIQAAILANCQADASSFVKLSDVHNSLIDFSPAGALSDYGYPRLREFILASGIVESKMEGSVAFVRLKDGWRDAITTAEPLTTSVPLPPPTEEENPAISSVDPFGRKTHDRVAPALIKFGDGWRDTKDTVITTEPLTSVPLPPPVEENPAIANVKPLGLTALESIRTAIMHLSRHNDVDAFIDISLVGQHLAKPSPATGAVALDYKDYGHSTLRDFLQASRIVELKGSNSSALVRLDNRHNRSMPPPSRSSSPFEEFPPPASLGNKPIDEAALEGIRQTITANLRDGQDPFDYIYFHTFAKHYLAKLPPALHHHHYGFSRLRDFALASGIVELEFEDGTALIRLKDDSLIDRATLKVLRRAIAASPPYKGGSFVKISDVGKCLLEASPDFKPENYGFRRLRDFVLASGKVEMHKVGSAWLVRLWDWFELREASREERERNMRETMKRDEDGDEDGALLDSKDAHGPRDLGLPRPLAPAEDEHEHRHGRETSLALVSLEAEHDCQHGTPPQSNDEHGYEYRRSLALLHPEDLHEHDLEHRTPLATKAEPENEHKTSSAVMTSEESHGHENDQQGIGMPLTLGYAPKHEHETLVALKGLRRW